MIRLFINTLVVVFLLLTTAVYAQKDSSNTIVEDSINAAVLKEYHKKIAELEAQRVSDSLKKVELENNLTQLKASDSHKKEALEKELKSIEENEKKLLASKKEKMDSLRAIIPGYPVLGPLEDTLFIIYSRIGSSRPQERASIISSKINKLFEDDFFKEDSLIIVKSEYTYDIVYGEMIIMSISEGDATWYAVPIPELAQLSRNKIAESISYAKNETSEYKLISRIGLVVLVVTIVWFIFWLIQLGHRKVLVYLDANRKSWLKSLSYKDYTFLTAEQEFNIIQFLLRIILWFVYVILLYITLPVIFSIFPFSRNWADKLFRLIWEPFHEILISVWEYLPNLFSIILIYYIMKYVIRIVHYIFHEIELKKLKISGFHADWAMPTFSIIRFLLYAFMFVLIFPYLPGSDSNIFKGVSVFIGVLFSLGSSSAISNVISGLVITYMRPFKIGDRIKIGEVTGDVIEKTLLVTRVKTIKNEIITIPNSAVLTGNTTNFTSEAQDNGLILYTTVTIGYDVPWRDMHKALIEAALKTNMILEEPKPFVFQTSLDDFYVSYQLNAFTREASKQALIYSLLHQNIQDVCNEKGIEIMSPHYRAQRDGSQTTIPASYIQDDKTKPGFNFKPDNRD